MSVLIWHYHDKGVSAPPANIVLNINGLPEDLDSVKMTHFRIDHDHSNAYSMWKLMGAPKVPTQNQLIELEKSSQLEALHDPVDVGIKKGHLVTEFQLPRLALSLILIEW